MADQLPSLFALIGVLATVAANMILSYIKNRSDRIVTTDDAEGEFQERLIAVYNAQQVQIDKLVERIHKLEEEIDLKRTQIHAILDEKYVAERDLRIIKDALKEREDYIARMENRVWYNPDKKADNKEGQ